MDAAPKPLITNVAVALNAVLTAVDNEQPKVLCVEAGGDGLPYGPFDPERHRTFEIGMREWVTRQTKVSLGYIEQLYTFGDKGREAPAAALVGSTPRERIISVGYLALASAPSGYLSEGASWRNWYGFFPWEDWRQGEPAALREKILPPLYAWSKKTNASGQKDRKARIDIAFGQGGMAWEEERTLDRYELMYEAGLVFEALRDRNAEKSKNLNASVGMERGAVMISDHRRILATAIGRLRGKLKYRPILFEMTPPTFTLLQLQRMVEAIIGYRFHKQNFRRSIEKSGFVERTGEMTQIGGGRPAALFCVDRTGLRIGAASGLAIPRLRRAED